MEIKNIKVGDKVQIRKDLSQEELVKLVEEHYIDREDLENLQTRGEVTVRSIQEKNNEHGWASIVLEEGLSYYWPVEIFEPTIKSKEEQVQEDIQKIKDIIKRYNLENKTMASLLVGWLEQFGQDSLNKKCMELKDIKVGDKVQVRKDIPEKELTELLSKCYLTTDNVLKLQRRGEVIVEGIQKANPKIRKDDWDSITLVDSTFFWPIELFEPVSKTGIE